MANHRAIKMLGTKKKLQASHFLMIALGCEPDGFTTIKDCDGQYTDKPRLGDLFMVKCDSSSGGTGGLGYYHAGVYCNEEEEEIIHFRVSSSQPSSSSIPSCSNISGPGEVSKVHVDMFCGQDKYAIYRKETGIPDSFRANVRAAMRNTPKCYNVSEYNCIHFALELLNVDLKTIDDYIKRFMKITSNKMKDKRTEMLLMNP
ncbi:hypothetical protein AMELA_G00083090 [Ameiurus melas]|uniref:LRAT domain-containing protein n=1 Tax=Ameiurus melas TaxID=219545 RepID=A0A7J6B071_AMEME|nr:hypothetical protein AMELA_G00083090 [Ameiurus melas]